MQFYQLSLESMIAKPATCKKIKNKIPVRHACANPDNSNGGGGSNCFSRAVRTSFYSRKQMATYDFHGEVRTPAPSVSAHIRVSNCLNSHFIYFFAEPGQFTKRLLIISADATGKDSMIYLRSKRQRTSNSDHVLF